MSLPKAGFARKSGAAILGVALLGSLMLSACAPSPSPEGGSETSASASASAPKGVTKFQSAAFDLDKQVSVDVKKEDTNILLGNGVISGDTSTDAAQSITFTPYEDKDKAWKYELKEPLSSARFDLMLWKGKTYVVVQGWSEKSSEASGLQAAKTTTTQVAIVLDTETGKEANTFRSVETERGTAPDTTYYAQIPKYAPQATSGSDYTGYIHHTIPTGLLLGNGEGHRKLLDPLTGAEIAVYDQQRASKSLINNETGFYEYAYSDVLNTDGVPKAKATFGNFVLVVTSLPESRSKTGSYVQSSKYALVNSVTKATVSEVVCSGDGNGLDSDNVSYSPNLRYVNFGGVVFDTESKAAFCSSPLDESVRKLTVTDVDNEGNMFAMADRQYLKVNVADTTKVETLVEDFNAAASELPILITDKGSALFYSENSEDTLVAVPAK